jgi:hypothetical protein
MRLYCVPTDAAADPEEVLLMTVPSREPSTSESFRLLGVVDSDIIALDSAYSMMYVAKYFKKYLVKLLK